MLEHNLFLVFIKKLNTLGVPYFVTGSVAAIAYSEPRLTHDIDIVVFLRDADIPVLIDMFNKEDEFYVPPIEVIKNENKRQSRGHFNLIHNETGFKADIYLTGNDPLHSWAMKRRRKILLDNTELSIAPPEYVIIRKFEYFEEGGSDKHLRDIKSIITNSSENIDYDFIKEHIKSEKLINSFNDMLRER